MWSCSLCTLYQTILCDYISAISAKLRVVTCTQHFDEESKKCGLCIQQRQTLSSHSKCLLLLLQTGDQIQDMELLYLVKKRKVNPLIRPLTLLKVEDGESSREVLRGSNEAVQFPLSEDDLSTLLSMESLLYKLGGVGLAAPQVDVNKRMAVIFIPKAAASHGVQPRAMHEIINPQYEAVGGDSRTVEEVEGCHSVRCIKGPVTRPDQIRVTYQDRLGVSHHREEDGFYSRVLQHEIDHLNGVMFVDRLVLGNLHPRDEYHLLLT